MTKLTKLLLLNIIVFFVVSRAYAGPATDLAELLAGLDQFSADFAQTITTHDEELIQSAAGTVYAQRPTKLRWVITDPDEQLIVIDGEKVWRYETDLEQVTVDNYDHAAHSAPSIILSGDAEGLNNKFKVSLKDGGFMLVPKDSSSLFVQIYVRFDQGLIAQLNITDGFEQITEIKFSNVDNTSEHSEDLYIFTPPEGIDILRND
jgi:outer membrane lipoprotein carrier protein